MNDTELRSRLQVLVDPPLADRPSRTALEDRAARRARVRRVAAAAAAAAVVLVAATVFATVGWPWSRSTEYVRVDDPAATATDASGPSDKDPSQMTDAELAAELDRIIRSNETVADGVNLYFGLGAELLGGEGDPRGVDTWWNQPFQAPSELAAAIDEYVAEGLAPGSAGPGYLVGEDRTVALLRELADRLRDMPAPQRGSYEATVGGARVPVPELADHGMQGLDDIARMGDVVVALGEVEAEQSSAQGLLDSPVAVVSSDGGRTWEFVDLAGQGMGDWEITDVTVAGDRFVLSGAVTGQRSQPAAAVSEDGGRTWLPMRFPDGSTGTVLDVTGVSDGRIVAVGKQAGGAALWSSTDGLRFSAVDAPEPAASVMAVADGTSGLVAVARPEDGDGAMLLWRSDDGNDWQASPPAGLPGGLIPDHPESVAAALEWLDGRYVMIGNGSDGVLVWQSDDGPNWQPLELEPADDMVAALAFDVTIDPEGRLVVAGGVRTRNSDRWPSPAVWHETPGNPSLQPAVHTEVEGIVTGIIGGNTELLAVGVAYPTDADGGDGVIWNLSRWQQVNP